MGKKRDLTGQCFGMLTVIERMQETTGKCKNCGCLRQEIWKTYRINCTGWHMCRMAGKT